MDIWGSCARISWPKTSVRAIKILEKGKHLGADIHDPKARTSTTLRDFQKLRSEKHWAEFSFPMLQLQHHADGMPRDLIYTLQLHLMSISSLDSIMCKWTRPFWGTDRDCQNQKSPKLSLFSGTKKGINIKNFAKTPPLPDPHSKGSLNPQILYDVGASFPLEIQGREKT